MPLSEQSQEPIYEMTAHIQEMEKKCSRLLELVQLAYIQGRNDEKASNRPPYIKIINGWEEFKKEHQL